MECRPHHYEINPSMCNARMPCIEKALMKAKVIVRISKKALHQIAQVSLEGSKEHYRFVLENSVAYEREVRPTVGRRRRRQLGEHWEKNNHGDSLVLV